MYIVISHGPNNYNTGKEVMRFQLYDDGGALGRSALY